MNKINLNRESCLTNKNPEFNISEIVCEKVRKLNVKNLALSEIVKIEIINQDSGAKRNYKLTQKLSLIFFLDYLNSELTISDLL